MLEMLYTLRALWQKRPQAAGPPSTRAYTIAYIHGPGHCGSTLLNLLLNAHPQAIGLSELQTLHAVFAGAEGAGLKETTFWRSVMREFEGRWGSPLLDPRNRLEPRDWGAYRRLSPQALHRLGEINRALFDSISAVSGARVICDSSKFLGRLHLLLSAELPVQVISLHRDGRAVLHSYLRKGYSTRGAFGRWGGATVEYLALAHWLPPRRLLFCRYEELARTPQRALRRICDFLGLPFDERMIQEFKRVPDYGIGGNRMRRLPHRAIRPDESWRRELSRTRRLGFWLRGGWLQYPVRLRGHWANRAHRFPARPHHGDTVADAGP